MDPNIDEGPWLGACPVASLALQLRAGSDSDLEAGSAAEGGAGRVARQPRIALIVVVSRAEARSQRRCRGGHGSHLHIKRLRGCGSGW